MSSSCATRDQLLTSIAPRQETSGNKISVIGSGQVGMACAFSLLTMNVASEISLCDMVADKVKGEMLDLQHGSLFLGNARINADTHYSVTANSRICIITAGARQQEGETRLDLVQKNTNIFKSIIPQLVKYSPDTILLVVSNPCDILTYITWKLSGLPKNRVFGSGTNLDSSRFRFLLSQRLNIGATSCHGWIIGEHGDTSVPLWSAVNIAGIRLSELNPAIGTPEDPEKWSELHVQVVNSAYEVIKLKGYTSWAIGLSVAELCKAITRNTGGVYAVSTLVNGMHGINKDVFLSVPCVLGSNGVTSAVKQTLTDNERGQLQKSAALMYEVQSGLTL